MSQQQSNSQATVNTASFGGAQMSSSGPDSDQDAQELQALAEQALAEQDLQQLQALAEQVDRLTEAVKNAKEAVDKAKEELNKKLGSNNADEKKALAEAKEVLQELKEALQEAENAKEVLQKLGKEVDELGEEEVDLTEEVDELGEEEVDLTEAVGNDKVDNEVDELGEEEVDLTEAVDNKVQTKVEKRVEAAPIEEVKQTPLEQKLTAEANDLAAEVTTLLSEVTAAERGIVAQQKVVLDAKANLEKKPKNNTDETLALTTNQVELKKLEELLTLKREALAPVLESLVETQAKFAEKQKALVEALQAQQKETQTEVDAQQKVVDAVKKAEEKAEETVKKATGDVKTEAEKQLNALKAKAIEEEEKLTAVKRKSKAQSDKLKAEQQKLTKAEKGKVDALAKANNLRGHAHAKLLTNTQKYLELDLLQRNQLLDEVATSFNKVTPEREVGIIGGAIKTFSALETGINAKAGLKFGAGVAVIGLASVLGGCMAKAASQASGTTSINDSLKEVMSDVFPEALVALLAAALLMAVARTLLGAFAKGVVAIDLVEDKYKLFTLQQTINTAMSDITANPLNFNAFKNLEDATKTLVEYGSMNGADGKPMLENDTVNAYKAALNKISEARPSTELAAAVVKIQNKIALAETQIQNGSSTRSLTQKQQKKNTTAGKGFKNNETSQNYVARKTDKLRIIMSTSSKPITAALLSSKASGQVKGK